MIALLCAAAVTLSVEPVELRPSAEAQATVRVLSSERPLLSTSAGTLEDLREESPGRWVARLVPPEEAVPQVALVAAAAGGEVSFAVVRLFGLGDAEVKTRPRGRISVTIGDERFGPVQADAHGLAQVPVVVPPGVAVAMHGAQPVDLHVPRTRTLQLALVQAAAPADQPAQVELRLFVVTAAGEPRAGARIGLRAGAGEVGPVRELGAGLYAATWSVPREREGEDTVQASLEEAPELAARAALQRGAGPAAAIVLTPSRSRLVAGEPELEVMAELRDAAGNPASDELRVAVSPGAAVVEPVAPGEARVRVRLPAAFAGAAELRLLASCARGPATAQLALPLLPAAPASTRLLLGASPVRADGAAQIPLRVQVEDRFGNPVPGAALVAEAQGGKVTAPASLGGGAFGATFTPPLLREPGSALLRVRAGESVGDLRVPLAPSQRLFALSPKLGAVTNLGRITSPLFSLEAALRFERLGTQLAVLVEASWFFASHGDAVVADGQPVGASTRADFLPLAAGLSWRPFVAPHAQAFFTLGPSLLFQRASQQFANQPRLSQGAVTAGAFVSAGAELRLGRFVPMVEARYSWQRDPGLFTLQNPVRGFALLFGSRFEIL